MSRIDRLLIRLVEEGGSDLHLSAGAVPMVRVDGGLRALPEPPVSAEDAAGLFGEIMPPDVRLVFNEQLECDFAYSMGQLGRFRVNVFLDHNGVGGVFRLVPNTVPTFDDLQLPEAIRRLATLPKGLVLVTGPTGSGKSTTLAAIIDEINRTRPAHIITIEDPLEFLHANQRSLVNQREVGVHTKSFANALRAALREDPDVILVGEMRDLETTAMAVEAAETGHLVFSTLHTSSAATTVDRILSQFPAEGQSQIRTALSSALQGVVAQTLARRQQGRGRVAALEIMVSTPAIAALIREGKTHQIPSAIQTGGRLGMSLLNDAIVKLVSRRVIDAGEGYRKATDKEGLDRAYQIAGIRLGAPAEGHSRQVDRTRRRVR